MAKTLVILLLAAAAFSSRLSDAAAAMKPGEWLNFGVSNLTNTGMWMTSTPNHGGSIASYAQQAVWDHHTHRLIFTGSGHRCPALVLLYDAATDRWSNIPTPRNPQQVIENGTTYWNNSMWHAYDQGTYTPENGAFYRIVINPDPGTARQPRYGGDVLYRYLFRESRWDTVFCFFPPDNGQQNPSLYCNGGAMQYFPDIHSLVMYAGMYGAKSTILDLNDTAGNDTVTWKNLTGNASSIGMYNVVMEYVPQYQKMVIMSNYGSQIMHANKTFTKITPPVGPDPDGDFGDFIRAAVDPNSGELLVMDMKNLRFFAYTIPTNTWHSLPLNGGLFSTPGSSSMMWLMTAIPEYGIISMLSLPEWTEAGLPAKLLLYKHSAGSATESAPKNISRASGPLFRAAVYNCAGKKVRAFPGGIPASVRWDGRDSFGRTAPAGIYVMELRNGHGERFWKKTLLIK